MFAPTDKAFRAVPKEILEELKKNKELLTQVLTYHVVSGKVTSDQLKNDQIVDTVEAKSKIRVNIYGKVWYAFFPEH